jgi:hypothetical protein
MMKIISHPPGLIFGFWLPLVIRIGIKESSRLKPFHLGSLFVGGIFIAMAPGFRKTLILFFTGYRE